MRRGRLLLGCALGAAFCWLGLTGCGSDDDDDSVDPSGGAADGTGASSGSGGSGGADTGGTNSGGVEPTGGATATGGSGGSSGSSGGAAAGSGGQTGGSGPGGSSTGGSSATGGASGSSGGGGTAGGGRGGSGPTGGSAGTGGTAGLTGSGGEAGGSGGAAAGAGLGGIAGLAGQSGGGDGGSGNDAGASGAGVLIPPGPGISCGGETCDEEAEYCCLDDSSVSCGPYCGGGVFRLECDDSLDCPGEVCCFVNALESAFTATHCAADCGEYAVEVCNAVGDCSNGDSCHVYTCSHPINPAVGFTLGLCTGAEVAYCE